MVTTGTTAIALAMVLMPFLRVPWLDLANVSAAVVGLSGSLESCDGGVLEPSGRSKTRSGVCFGVCLSFTTGRLMRLSDFCCISNDLSPAMTSSRAWSMSRASSSAPLSEVTDMDIDVSITEEEEEDIDVCLRKSRVSCMGDRSLALEMLVERSRVIPKLLRDVESGAGSWSTPMMSVSRMMMGCEVEVVVGWVVEVVDLSEVSSPESLLTCRTTGFAGKD